MHCPPPVGSTGPTPAFVPVEPLCAEAAQITAATDTAAAEYSEGRQQLAAAAAAIRTAMQQPQHSLHFLRPGRIVRVTEGGAAAWSCAAHCGLLAGHVQSTAGCWLLAAAKLGGQIGVRRPSRQAQWSLFQSWLTAADLPCAPSPTKRRAAVGLWRSRLSTSTLAHCEPLFLWHSVFAGERQWGFGVVVSVLRKSAQDRVGVPESAAAAYIVDTLLCAGGSGGDYGKERERKRETQGAPQPAALTDSNAEMQVRYS